MSISYEKLGVFPDDKSNFCGISRVIEYSTYRYYIVYRTLVHC